MSCVVSIKASDIATQHDSDDKRARAGNIATTLPGNKFCGLITDDDLRPDALTKRSVSLWVSGVHDTPSAALRLKQNANIIELSDHTRATGVTNVFISHDFPRK